MSGSVIPVSVHTLWRVRQTTFQMLRDRGYTLDETIASESLEVFAANYEACEQTLPEEKVRDALIIRAEKQDDPDDVIIVYFPTLKGRNKVGVKPIRDLSARLLLVGVSHGILIVPHDLTVVARLALQEAQSSLRVEVFMEKELMINITQHELVPKHEIMSETEKHDLLQKYKVNSRQLPRILETDPVARYLGVRKGNVVRITRPSETAGRYVSYRICV